MNPTEIYVLPKDAVLTPVRDLPEASRRDIGDHDDGDLVICRPNSRVFSKLVGAQTSELIAQFRTPKTIAQAVARFSRKAGLDAEAELEEALPVLQSLIGAGLLVPFDATNAPAIAPSLSGKIDGWTILQPVQTMEDTEIYQVRRNSREIAALKIGRVGHPTAARALEHEVRVLSCLDSVVAPRLLSFGCWNSRPYLMTEWFVGSDAGKVCAEFRARLGPDRKHDLLTVTSAILRAYAALHDRGVIHGDIHARNVLVDRHRCAKILDFGAAWIVGKNKLETAPRPGVGFFFEPELAEAARAGASLPSPTPQGEQYSLAALIYFLLTGRHYLDFTVAKNEMLRQIAEDEMLSFARRGLAAWPQAERALRKALNKEPGDRFSSVAEFASAWEHVAAPSSGIRPVPSDHSQLQSIREELITEASVSGPLMQRASLPEPATSVSCGSAGVAYALYRISCASDDGELLAVADIWSTKALAQLYDSTTDSMSLYHGPAGVYAVHALIARARGDAASKDGAIRSFIKICAQPFDSPDLLLGQAGALLGCALLLESGDHAELRRTGDYLQDALGHLIDGYPAIADSHELSALGLAHGLPGLLYAALCWSIVACNPVTATIERRLRELAGGGELVGRAPGWCNGSAGLVFLWTAAYRATGDRSFLELAERAGRNVSEAKAAAYGLCCGMAGHAYALLNLYRHSGDAAWLQRASEIASRATTAYADQRNREESDSSESRMAGLYKGGAGIAVLSADIERPDEARMPMLECEF